MRQELAVLASASTSVFDLHPTSITTSNGTDQTFRCNARAFPEPTYVWMKVGGDLPEMALGANTSMLTLSPAVFEDQGEYFCDATSNGVTVSSNTATLTSELALQGLFMGDCLSDMGQYTCRATVRFETLGETHTSEKTFLVNVEGICVPLIKA